MTTKKPATPAAVPGAVAPVVNPKVVTARTDPQVLASASITNGMTQEAIDARIAQILGVPLHV